MLIYVVRLHDSLDQWIPWIILLQYLDSWCYGKGMDEQVCTDLIKYSPLLECTYTGRHSTHALKTCTALIGVMYTWCTDLEFWQRRAEITDGINDIYIRADHSEMEGFSCHRGPISPQQMFQLKGCSKTPLPSAPLLLYFFRLYFLACPPFWCSTN